MRSDGGCCGMALDLLRVLYCIVRIFVKEIVWLK